MIIDIVIIKSLQTDGGTAILKLEQRINQKKKQGKIDKNAKLNQKLLMNEYYKYWLQIDNNQDKVVKLLAHPLLTVADHNKVEQIYQQQSVKQQKVGGLMAVGSFAFYWLFLSRKQSFYNFFNNKKSSRVSNILKKTLGVYSLFLGSMIILQFQFKNAVPMRLNELGYFKKYRLSFDKRIF